MHTAGSNRAPGHRLPGYALPIGLFALALALRCYGLTAPLLDYHSWRQADTAAIARNFVHNGYRLFYPQVDWGGLTPGYVESEFPLYSFSVALLYSLLGIHEWAGRLLSALASAAACLALYGLGRRLLPWRAALYAGLVLALMPFAIYFGRTVMPDSLMLLTAILAIWALVRWVDQPTLPRLVVAALCGMLATLAKTPNLVIVALPALLITWPVLHQRRLWPQLVLYATCVAVPILLWTAHAQRLPLDPRLSFGIAEKLFDLRLLTDAQFYVLLARWSVANVLTLAGVPFLLLGMLRTSAGPPGQRQLPWLPHAWLLGVLVFLLAGAAGVVGQEYYILPLAPPAALLAGAGIDRAQRFVEGRLGHRWGQSVAPVALSALALLSLLRVAPLYQTTDFYQTLGRRVDLALPEGARVGVIAPAVSEILYYAERQGWRLDPGVLVPGGIASLKVDLGVRYVLVADPWLSERRDVLTQALRDFRRVPVGPYALLLDLERPGEQAPFEVAWETGHMVSGAFLEGWHAFGGVERLGLPISEALVIDGVRQQYFERGVLIEERSAVARAPVGRWLLEANGGMPEPGDTRGSFHDAWVEAGGEAWLGAAISPVVQQADGTLAQYFDYGLLEATGGGAVTLAHSGRRLLVAHGLSEERQIVLARRAAES